MDPQEKAMEVATDTCVVQEAEKRFRTRLEVSKVIALEIAGRFIEESAQVDTLGCARWLTDITFAVYDRLRELEKQ